MTSRGYQNNFYELSEGVRDELGRKRKARKIAKLLQTCYLSSLSGLVCVDIGCSSGFITTELADLFLQTIGIEYDAIALRQAYRLVKPSLRFARGDAMHLPIASNSVDVIICAQVYEHVPSDEKMVAEMERVLKPGGLVFFSGPNWLFPIEPHYFIPFLHWMPEPWADKILQIKGNGNHYYERSRTWWGLHRLFRQFTIKDFSIDVLFDEIAHHLPPWIYKCLRMLPRGTWSWLVIWLPNFNWILEKPK